MSKAKKYNLSGEIPDEKKIQIKEIQQRIFLCIPSEMQIKIFTLTNYIGSGKSDNFFKIFLSIHSIKYTEKRTLRPLFKSVLNFEGL